MTTPTKKQKTSKGVGFCSALSMLSSEQSESSSATIACENDGARFQSASTLLGKACDKGSETSLENNVETTEVTTVAGSRSETSDERRRTFSLTLTVRGLQYYDELSETVKIGDSVVIEREPDNEYDSNAIRVTTKSSGGEVAHQIGHIAKEQACRIASDLDTRLMQVVDAVVKKPPSSFMNKEQESWNAQKMTLHVTISTVLTARQTIDLERCWGGSIDVERLSKDFAKVDLKQSKSSPFLLEDLKQKQKPQWRPVPEFTYKRKGMVESVTGLEHWWKNEAKGVDLEVSVEEAENAQSKQWPPSDSILSKLGLGKAHDSSWWKKHGLRPPATWNVQDAYCLLESSDVKLSSETHRKRTQQVLEGAIHGVDGVWLPEVLLEIRQLVHQQDFWVYRQNDAFIRAFGGPYVLGQQKDRLTLLRGAPHTKLTEKICRAHNIIYTVIHLKPPVSPGFNSIIFGLTLRRSGFHYHQDSIGELEEKNVPLLNRQPVVTSVFYEHPTTDSEKEVVLWQPILNWTPTGRRDEFGNLYQAARVLPTSHGTVHVQRAGLQFVAKHGVFHTPTASSDNDHQRTGYRIAITARITHCDADERVQKYLDKGSYRTVIGPGGDKTLPPSSFDDTADQSS